MDKDAQEGALYQSIHSKTSEHLQSHGALRPGIKA